MREISLSEWLFLSVGILLVQEAMSIIAYSLFVFELIRNHHLGASKNVFTYIIDLTPYITTRKTQFT